MTIRRLVSVAVLAVSALIGGLALAGSASAHVTVSAPGAISGGSDQLITFRVPDESAKAATIELEVSFPTSTPIASALPQPHPGWTVTTTSVKLATPIVTDDGDILEAVSTITWKAKTAADGIQVGQFDEFNVIAGQLPDAPSLTFPSIQTYSDGTVVKWIEVRAPGSTTEPDHPAPVLNLPKETSSQTPLNATKVEKANTTGSTILAVVALVLAVLACGGLVVTRARMNRR